MQKLEDTFTESGCEGPAVDIGQRLAMWPFKSATWSRNVYQTVEMSQAGCSQAASQPTAQPEPERQRIDYMLVYFTVRLLLLKKACSSILVQPKSLIKFSLAECVCK